MPYLYSERLRFRAAERSDIPQFLKWINDPEVTENLMHHYPISITEEESWYESMIKNPAAEHVLVMEVKKAGEDQPDSDTWFPIGNIQFLDIHWRGLHTEIGIMIGEKDYWDQGYGTEAMRLMLEHGFGTLNLHRIWLQVYNKNIRGIRAYDKAGFIVEGRLREAHYQHGRYYDTIIMSVLRSEWEAHKR